MSRFFFVLCLGTRKLRNMRMTIKITLLYKNLTSISSNSCLFQNVLNTLQAVKNKFPKLIICVKPQSLPFIFPLLVLFNEESSSQFQDSLLLQPSYKNMPKILMKIFQVIVKVFKNCIVEGNHLEKIVFQVIPKIYHNLDFLSAGIFAYQR